MILLISQYNSFSQVNKLISSINFSKCKLVLVNQSQKKFISPDIDVINLNKTISLSKSRNMALDYSLKKGYFKLIDFIMFPDDDAVFCSHFWDYSERYIKKTSLLDVHYGEDKIFRNRWLSFLKYKSVMSSNIIVSIKDFNNFRFDENLGLGAKYGSGEDIDLFWTIGEKKFEFIKDIYIHHPLSSSDDVNLNKSFNTLGNYFLGHLAVCNKHKRFIPILISILFPLFKIIILKNILVNFKIFKSRLNIFVSFYINKIN